MARAQTRKLAAERSNSGKCQCGGEHPVLRVLSFVGIVFLFIYFVVLVSNNEFYTLGIDGLFFPYAKLIFSLAAVVVSALLVAKFFACYSKSKCNFCLAKGIIVAAVLLIALLHLGYYATYVSLFADANTTTELKPTGISEIVLSLRCFANVLFTINYLGLAFVSVLLLSAFKSYVSHAVCNHCNCK
ncbi:MAG: hypothetical protein LBC33_02430 [Mycoplasmataceae bacterium]|nr:hypothetical protein [Mycoplasmataceae bacterium]